MTLAESIQGSIEASASLEVENLEVTYGRVIVAVQGERAVQAVQVVELQGGTTESIAADLIASAGGLTPDVNLYSQAGGSLVWNEAASMFVPERAVPGVAVVGACAGALDLETALAHADAVGRGAGEAAPRAPVGGAGHVPADTRPPAAALAPGAGKIFVDLHNDVTCADVELAARENYRSVEHFKRYTTGQVSGIHTGHYGEES